MALGVVKNKFTETAHLKVNIAGQSNALYKRNKVMMKKIVLGIIYFLGLSILAQAQYSQDSNSTNGELRLGFQLSPSVSWISTDDKAINGNGGAVGMRLGMMGEYYFRENYALISGINFAFNQGGTLLHEEGGNFWSKSELSDTALTALPNGVNLKYHIQYIEVPLGIKMRTKEFGYIRYFAEIPLFSLGVKVQARGDIKGTSRLDTERENIKEDVNLFNVNWGFGGGIHYALSEDTAFIGGLYYQQGISDITDDAGFKTSGAQEKSKGVLQSITLRIGILF